MSKDGGIRQDRPHPEEVTNMDAVTLPTVKYGGIGINGFPAPAMELFRYENVYRRADSKFALEFRQQIIALREQGLKLGEIAENLNCSISVVKKWLHRYHSGDIIGDKSRAPVHRVIKNTHYHQSLVAQIVTEFPFFGCRRIAHEIEKNYGEKISHVTVSQMMKDIQEKKEPVVAERIEIDEVDKIWHMDMTPKRIAGGKMMYIFAVMDACTRRILALKSYEGCTSVEVIDCLYKAIINNNGKKPRILYTDNGGQFVSKIFEDCLSVQCIFHHRIDKGKPWQNGKVERLFRTLFDEWIDWNNYQSPKGLSDSMEAFRNWYNNEREIQKLDYKTPMQLLKEKTISS